uniref:Uncharacterized protein n=1 Tax=Vespula pensylvanica TaxID=30213 RepID=A0A834PDE0_VESPE|nr:hypothetical protein H0235_004148 [Vespula pensylvanica]
MPGTRRQQRDVPLPCVHERPRRSTRRAFLLYEDTADYENSEPSGEGEEGREREAVSRDPNAWVDARGEEEADRKQLVSRVPSRKRSSVGFSFSSLRSPLFYWTAKKREAPEEGGQEEEVETTYLDSYARWGPFIAESTVSSPRSPGYLR